MPNDLVRECYQLTRETAGGEYEQGGLAWRADRAQWFSRVLADASQVTGHLSHYMAAPGALLAGIYRTGRPAALSCRRLSCAALASNPGPHHFDLLDLREEGLGKLPAIFGLLPRFQGKI